MRTGAKIAKCPVCRQDIIAITEPTSGQEIAVELRGTCEHIEDRDVVLRAREMATVHAGGPTTPMPEEDDIGGYYAARNALQLPVRDDWSQRGGPCSGC